MSEAERHIAAFNRARVAHVWNAAVRLQKEVLELREENAKLLRALRAVRRIVAESWMTEERVYRLVREASDGVISRAEDVRR